MKSFLFGAVKNLITQFKETYAQVKKEREDKERQNLQQNFVKNEPQDIATPDIESRKNQGYKNIKRQNSYNKVEGNERNSNMAQRNY